MPDFQTIQKWISEKTFHSLEYHKRKIEIGTIDFSFRLRNDETGLNNPLEITLKSDRNIPCQALFSMASEYEPKPALVSIKKIAATPFYHSYMISPTLVADIVDFYNWGNEPNLYRLFLVQHAGSGGEVHISLPNTGPPSPVRHNVFQAGNFFWSAPDEGRLELGNKGMILMPRPDSGPVSVLTVSISRTDKAAGTGTIDSAYKLLESLTETALHHHIQHNYYINNRTLQVKLDDLWTRQKAFTPEWEIAWPILSDPLRYSRILTWVIEIAVYFNHWNLVAGVYQTLRQMLPAVKNDSWLLFLYARMEKLLVHSGVEESVPAALIDSPGPETGGQPGSTMDEQALEYFLYRNYFSTAGDMDMSGDFLQHYWNRLSLPLFETKLEKELKSNPEKVTILYLLGLHHDLPFAEVLAGKIDETLEDPVLRLFIFMQRYLPKRSYGQKVFSFKDGCRESITGKKINLFDQNTIQVTRFGEQFYVQYTAADKFRFKINKRIQINVDSTGRKISVYPAVPFYQQQLPADQRMEIRCADYDVSWPLLWPRAEINCAGIRFRWIFKKRRYQITLQQKKGSAALAIGGQQVDWSANKKMIHYFEIKSSQPEMLIKVLNMQAAEMHLRTKTSARPIQLAGWLKNRHNQFAEFLNYSYGSRQHILNGTGHNGIQANITIPAATTELSFRLRDLHCRAELVCSSGPFWDKFFSHSSQIDGGRLVVLMDELLQEKFLPIQNFFYEFFAFQPRYIFKEHAGLPVICSILIYISVTAEGVALCRDQRLASAPYLVVGVKKGIEQLKRFSDFVEQQLISIKKGSIKRFNKA